MAGSLTEVTSLDAIVKAYLDTASSSFLRGVAAVMEVAKMQSLPPVEEKAGFQEVIVRFTQVSSIDLASLAGVAGLEMAEDCTKRLAEGLEMGLKSLTGQLEELGQEFKPLLDTYSGIIDAMTTWDEASFFVESLCMFSLLV